MIRKAVKLAVFLLIANAAYQVAPAWIHYYQFRDAVKELALFAKETSPNALTDRVMAIAGDYHVPLAREDVQIQRGGDQLSISAAYVEMLKVVPGYVYRWDVSVETTAVNVAPPGGRGR